MPSSSSSNKRPSSPAFIPNPFIKKRNLEWTIQSPSPSTIASTTGASPSPKSTPSASPLTTPPPAPAPSPAVKHLRDPSVAAVESGAAQVVDHLAYFSSHLSKCILVPPPVPPVPTLFVAEYRTLYESNAGSPHGAHFVIHQHDHPVAGTHYDLRLQINETSSVSWAIMYGLPGDPNSIRLNRNATETRIHSLWNHLIETASPETGSLLIWDTGVYSILPRRSKHAPQDDPSSAPSSPSSDHSPSSQSLLHAAFQNRKIRLRLHGAKLPDPYVLNLRLTKTEDAAGRVKSLRSSSRPARRRRRKPAQQAAAATDTSSDEEIDEEDDGHVVPVTQDNGPAGEVSAVERELRELEDDQVRRTNAYPGASNTIGSIHQRKWYLSLDRAACGFVAKKRRGRASVWELAESREAPGNNEATEENQPPRLSYPFYVQGPAHERSVLTSRRGEHILRDEDVKDFMPRKGWAPVLK